MPPEDPGALAEAVVTLLAAEPRRVALAAAARVLAQERYAWPDIARRLLAIYEALVEHDRAQEPRVAVTS